MKIGNLVILEPRGEEWERCESDGKKIGIVRIVEADLSKVFWSCGDETWCLSEQLEVINETDKKCP